MVVCAFKLSIPGSKFLYRQIPAANTCQANPDFSNLIGKQKLIRKIGRFKKLRVKLQRSISKGNENWFKKSGGLKN